MTLIQDSANPARWTDDRWTPGTPGTFAVVIGASRYRHLKKGDAPAAQTYDLGQLHVCALTAHRFFRWLRDGYRNPAAPLAGVWLLMAPSNEERALTEAQAPDDDEFVRHITAGVVEPTVAACERAIREWFYEMQQLPQPASEASRAFFFFTGHGLEVTQEEQILLPSDYLQPPSVPEDAIAVRNLREGLAAIPVRDQFFFLDACRNDHQALRALRLTGRPILSQPGSSAVFSSRNLSILYGSASGSQAWSPADPAQGPSIYGRALLEGLRAQDGVQVSCGGTPRECAVLTYSLHEFVRNRVTALLQERGAAVKQDVPLSGSRLENPRVTLVDEPPLEPRKGPPPQTPPPSPPKIHDVFFHPTFASTVGIRPGGSAAEQGEGSLHDKFQSEGVTATFGSLRLFSLDAREWLQPDAHVLHRVERDEPGRVFRVDLRIPAADGPVWMQMDTLDGQRLACILPGDIKAPRYRINVYRDAVHHRVTGMEVRLSPEQESGILRQAALLWDAYRKGNVHDVAHSGAMDQLENMLRSKMTSPLAATIAGLILLRAGAYGRMHHWPRNLANRFSYPDGSVIWAEQLLRTPPLTEAARAEAETFTVQAAHRGLPVTSEAVGYLSAQLHPDTLGAEAEWLARRLPWFQSGGLFTVLMGPPDAVTYGLALGTDEEQLAGAAADLAVVAG